MKKNFGDGEVYKEGRLSFNPRNGRYGIRMNNGIGEGWLVAGLHCGCIIDFYRDGKLYEDRLDVNDYPADYPNAWYLVYSRLRGKQLESLYVHIRKWEDSDIY